MPERMTAVDKTESGLYVARPRIPVDAASACIPQIAERGQDGKQSCFLTSALNGLVLRSTITTEQAQTAQEQLAGDRRYADFWVPSDGFTAWDNNAERTSQAIGRVLGAEVSIRAVPASKLSDALQAGRVAIVTNNLHARAVFQNEDGAAAIVDPYRTETVAVRDLAQAPSLHEAERSIIVI
jgi:hypothetical protein